MPRLRGWEGYHRTPAGGLQFPAGGRQSQYPRERPMNSKLFNLALMCLWLTLCVGVMTREWWAPDGMRARIDTWNPTLVMAVSGLLAVWNFVRFFVAWQFRGPTRPSPE